MGLDMVPLGRPRPGTEARSAEIFRLVQDDRLPEPSLADRLLGRLTPTRETLIEEWRSLQIPAYETIGAPVVGLDAVADRWLRDSYEKLQRKPTFAEYEPDYRNYYVVELAPVSDGTPVYQGISDTLAFRGQVLNNCDALIGEPLVSLAWVTKTTEEALTYGHRLMQVATDLAAARDLLYLRDQREPPAHDETSDASQLHVVFSLAKWLVFWGSRGHGYEADY